MTALLHRDLQRVDDNRLGGKTLDRGQGERQGARDDDLVVVVKVEHKAVTHRDTLHDTVFDPLGVHDFLLRRSGESSHKSTTSSAALLAVSLRCLGVPGGAVDDSSGGPVDAIAGIGC